MTDVRWQMSGDRENEKSPGIAGEQLASNNKMADVRI